MRMRAAAPLTLALILFSFTGSFACGRGQAAAGGSDLTGAEGTSTLNEETWTLTHALAYDRVGDFDESKTDTWVVLSTEPLEMEAVKDLEAFELVQLAVERQVAMVRLQVCRDGCSAMGSETPWAAAAQVFSPSRAGFSFVPDRMLDLELEVKPPSGRIEGRVVTAEPVPLEGDTWACDLRFGAEVLPL